MNEVVEQAQDVRPGPIVHTPAEPRQLTVVEYAVQRGASVQEVRALVELQVQMDNHKLAMMKAQADMARADRAEAAVRAYAEAFAAFKGEAVKIIKTKEITDGPLKGKKHAELGVILDAVTPALSKHGLSMSWRLTKDTPDWMEVTCTVRHVSGHSDAVSMGGGPDTGPGRNAIQARSSANSYLERITGLAILGLAAKDEDKDGAAPPVMVKGVLGGLLADVAKAADDAAAVALWNSGKKTLASLGDATAADEFKAALAARRRAIKGATC